MHNDGFNSNGPGLEGPAPGAGTDGPSLDSGDFTPRGSTGSTGFGAPQKGSPFSFGKKGKQPPPMGLVAFLLSLAAVVLSVITLWVAPATTPPKDDPVAKQIEALNAQVTKIGGRLGRVEQQVAVLVRVDRSEQVAALSAEIMQIKRQLQNVQAAPARQARQQAEVAADEPKQAVKTPAKKPAANKTTIVTVKKGQTLMAIARKYNVSVASLKKWNNLSDGNIKVGQKLTIRAER